MTHTETMLWMVGLIILLSIIVPALMVITHMLMKDKQ